MEALWTEISLAMPAIQALSEGYEGYFVIDASGDVTMEAHDMVSALHGTSGLMPVAWLGLPCRAKLQRDWVCESTVPGVAEVLPGSLYLVSLLRVLRFFLICFIRATSHQSSFYGIMNCRPFSLFQMNIEQRKALGFPMRSKVHEPL